MSSAKRAASRRSQNEGTQCLMVVVVSSGAEFAADSERLDSIELRSLAGTLCLKRQPLVTRYVFKFFNDFEMKSN